VFFVSLNNVNTGLTAAILQNRVPNRVPIRVHFCS